MERTNAKGQTVRTLRFFADGQRRAVNLGAVSRAEAEEKLAQELADVQRGVWRAAPKPATQSVPTDVPTFHVLAEQWWVRAESRLTKGSLADYKNRLEKHLIPAFEKTPVDQITLDGVEDYIAEKLGKGLSPRSVNMHVVLMAAILDGAVERGMIVGNPARGRKRRVRERAPARSYLDSATHINALLDAAGELDAEAPSNKRHIRRRAQTATLIFAGLRISECLALRWRDVDLAGGWLTIGQAKTDAGVRKVKIRGTLRDELTRLRADLGKVDPDSPVFATNTGKQMSAENFRNRVLRPAITRADKALVKAGLTPLPERLTPHSLRRTFASLLYAIGESPPVVMAEMGHTDPSLALSIYAKTMVRSDTEKAALVALVDGVTDATEESSQQSADGSGDAGTGEALAA